MVSYCPMCGKPVYFAERKRSLGKDYHSLCLKCYHCRRQLSPGQHAEYDDKPYCTYCYLQHFGPRGTRPLSASSSFTTSPSSKVPSAVRKTS
ncbi:cysteine-rich protein 2-like isoform X2 [Hemicordylus capensis]|uniref:cysteine-rich protein 2-like isoform X2 n=1 Tax=Hemicordylus capensis TaxID=884348 RepID=UPI002304A7E9|nr:cysteine-rich protein 2-like isoform X2 [Hemicordylus capensis]